MKRLNLILIFAFTIAAAVSVQAQRNVLRPGPTPTPGQQPTTKGMRVGITRDEAGPLLLPGVYGSIRWSKELGLPYDPSSGAQVSQYICSIFRVILSVRENSSGPPRLLRGVHFVDDTPVEVNGYYTCNYRERDDSEVPLNQPVTVTLDFSPRIPANLRTADWAVGSNTKPPAGQERTIIIIGGQPNSITLTDSQSRAKVDFEMVYGAARQPPTKP